MKFRKVFMFAICAAAALMLAACGGSTPADSGDTPADSSAALTGESDGDVGMPDPFTEYQTLEEAEKEAQFTLELPQAAGDYSGPVYRLNKEAGLLEVIFENGGERITFRKAAGDEDISGDYNEYAQVETVDGVTLKGENGMFSLAVWSSDGYTYAVSVHEAVSQSDMLALTAEVR